MERESFKRALNYLCKKLQPVAQGGRRTERKMFSFVNKEMRAVSQSYFYMTSNSAFLSPEFEIVFFYLYVRFFALQISFF